MTEFHITRRTVIIAALLLITVAGVSYALRPEVIDVDSYVASTSALRSTIDEDGRTRVRKRFAIAAPVTGRLERIALREGDPVNAGDVVAWLAPVPLDSAARRAAKARVDAAFALRDEASARIQQAQVALELAKRAESRSRTLLAAGAISPLEYERAAAGVREKSQEVVAARSRARSAHADLLAAQTSLAPTEGEGVRRVPVKSPVSGQVLRLPEPSERLVGAGSVILELGDARAIEVVTDVLSSDAVQIRAGDKVSIAEWGGDKPLIGRVARIEPAAFTRTSALGVEEQRVNVIIDVPDAPVSLGDGFRVEAQVITWESPSTLCIPSSAAFQRGGSWEVFTIDDGRARRRRISVGHGSSAMIEITSGLSKGERVILFPSDQIEDGIRVRDHVQG